MSKKDRLKNIHVFQTSTCGAGLLLEKDLVWFTQRAALVAAVFPLVREELERMHQEERNLEKSSFTFVNGCQWEIASRWWVGIHSMSPSHQHWAPIWPEPVQVLFLLPVSVSVCASVHSEPTRGFPKLHVFSHPNPLGLKSPTPYSMSQASVQGGGFRYQFHTKNDVVP